jgi:hypothetical protein
LRRNECLSFDGPRGDAGLEDRRQQVGAHIFATIAAEWNISSIDVFSNLNVEWIDICEFSDSVISAAVEQIAALLYSGSRRGSWTRRG